MPDLSNFKIDPDLNVDAVFDGVDGFEKEFGFKLDPNILEKQGSRSVYDVGSGETINVPTDIPLDQGFYFDDINSGRKRESGFFGFVDGAAQIASGAGAGAQVAFITAKQNMSSATVLREADIRADLYSRDMNFNDIVNIINVFDPTASKTTLGVLLAKGFLDKDQEYARSESARRNQKAIFNLIQKQKRELSLSGYDRPDGWAGIAYDIGGAGASIVTALGATALTRNPALVSAIFGSMQKNSLYIEAREKGKSQAFAGNISTIGGILEGGLEMIGLKTFFGLAAVDNILGRIVLRSAEEAVQEGVQQISEEILTQTSGLREVDVNGAFGRIAYSMMLGGIVGAPVATMVEIGNNVNVDDTVTPEAIELMARSLGQNREEYVDRITQIIDDEVSKSSDAVANKKVADILNKFDTGEQIDIKKEINDIKELSDAEKQALFEDIDNSVIGAKIKTENKVAQFRIDAIDEQVQNINRELKQLNNEISDRELLNKPTKAVEKKIAKLEAEKEKLDLQKEDLVNYFGGEKIGPVTEEEMLTRQEILDIAKGEKISMKGRVLEGIGKKSITELEKKTGQVFRKAQKISRDETGDAQKLVYDFIKETGLGKYKEGNKLLSKIKDIKTAKQAEKALPKLQLQADKLIAKLQKDEIQKAIKQKLKQTKLTKGGKLPKGKYTASAQRIFDAWREVSAMNKKTANERLKNNLESNVGDTIENTILLNKVNPDAVSPETLAEIYTGMSGAMKRVRGGVVDAYDSQFAAVDELKGLFIDGVTAGEGVVDRDTTKLKNKLLANLNNFRSYVSFNVNAWYDTLDLMLGKTREGRVAREALQKMVAKSILDEKIMTGHFQKKFHETYKDALGYSKERIAHKRLRLDEKPVLVGEFVRVGDVKKTPWTLSRAQMRYIYSALKNDKLRTKLTSKNGNKISDEMIKALERNLEQEDFDLIDAELQMYKDLYDAINPVYEKKYGVALNKEDFYVMSQSEHGKLLNDKDEFLEDLHHYSTATSSIMQKRTASESPIRIESDVRVMLNYISKASNFINKAEMSTVLHQVFGDPQVNMAIQKNWGDVMNNTIREMVDDFIVGHNKRVDLGYRIFDKVYQNFVISKLGLKLNMIPKQTSSFVGYMATIPADQWVVGFNDFLADPMNAIKILSETDYMKDVRGSSQDYNIMRQYAGNFQTVFKSGSVKVGEKMMLPVQLGDRFAIYAGGWAVYKYNIDVLGKTHEEAIADFIEKTELTQQSSMQDKLSRMQASSNPFVRTINMFASAPLGYLRAEMRAVRQAIRGEIPIKTAAKQVAIYHFILPALFQYIADGFYYDEDNQKRAMIAGPLTVFPILGDYFYKAIALYQGDRYKEKGFSIFSSIGEIFSEAVNMIQGDEVDMVDVLGAMGDLIGKPIGTGINIAGGLNDIAEDDILKGILRVTGGTERAAEERANR